MLIFDARGGEVELKALVGPGWMLIGVDVTNGEGVVGGNVGIALWAEAILLPAEVALM